jgi:hypothetical protein
VTHFQFQFGLKDQPKSRKHLTEDEINQAAKPGESRASVIARLTGTKVDDFAKPGETLDQALARKRALQDVKKKLR